MGMSPRQAQYLGHVLKAAGATGRLGWETAKLVPRMIRSSSKTRAGAAGLGFTAGTVVGYKAARGLQESARKFVFGQSR